MPKFKKILISALTAVLMVALLVSAVILSFPTDEMVHAWNTTSNIVNVGKDGVLSELAPDGEIDRAVLKDLYSKLAGSGADIDDVKAAAETAAGADTVKPYKGLNSVELRARNNSKDIIVKFGGLEWTVVYLSNDRNGDPVVTLWLKDSKQTTLGTTQFNTWQSATSNTNTSYVSSVYATSNVRAQLNLGTPVSSSATASARSVAQSPTSPFAAFTMTDSELQGSGKKSLMKFIDMPYLIEYQSTESWAYQGKKDLNLPGSAYGYPLANTGSYSPMQQNGFHNGNGSNFDFNSYTLYSYIAAIDGTPENSLTSKSNGKLTAHNNYLTRNMNLDETEIGKLYDDSKSTGEKWKKTVDWTHDQLEKVRSWTDAESWAFDTLWLPSTEEPGFETSPMTDNPPMSVWKCSVAQRADTSGNAWMRVSNISKANEAYSVTPAGSVSHVELVNNRSYIRPALHLNLASAYNSVPVPHDITVDYDGNAHSIDEAPWYDSELYSSGIKVTYDPADTTKAGVYDITLEIEDDGKVWSDAKDTSDKTRKIKMTVNPATISVQYNGKFSNDNKYIYRADSEKHKLCFPQSESDLPYNDTYIKLSDYATESDKKSVKIYYYYLTHTEDQHEDFIADIESKLNSAKLKWGPEDSSNTDASKDWTTYENGQASLEVSDPKGYCVFYRIEADNHEPQYGYFSVHIATEYLKVTTKSNLGEYDFGDTIDHIADEAALKDYVNDNVIQDITDNQGESRFEQLKTESHLFKFYLYKLSGSVQEKVSFGVRLDAGDYYIGVEYTAENKEDFIHVLWNPSGEDDGEHPKLTIKPKTVAIEWSTGVADDEAEKAKVSDEYAASYKNGLSWAFDDTEKTPTAKFTDVDGEEQSVTLSYSGNRKNAGTFTATAQEVKNYSFTGGEQDFEILKAKNGWKEEYRCLGGSVGGTPQERGGVPKFGSVTKTYYTDPTFNTKFDGASLTAGTYYVKLTVDGTFDYDGLDSSKESDQSKYTFTMSECEHDYFGQDYQSDGVQHWQICSKCNLPGNYSDHTPKDGGKLVQGETEHWLVCSVCDAEYSKAEHNYNVEGEIVKEATCSETGEQQFKCACGKIDPQNHEIKKTEHKLIDGWQTNDGKHWHECEVCHEHFDESNHKQTQIKAIAPTCDTSGNEAGVKCSECEKIIVEAKVREPLGHLYAEDDVTEIVKPTCDKAGRGTVHCTRCNNEVEVPVPARHSLQYYPEQPATVDAEGERAHYHCTECEKNFSDEKGKTVMANIVIPRLTTSSGAGDWLKDNWWWLVLAVAALLLILLIIFIITGVSRRRRERERDRQFETFMKMQMMHSYGGFSAPPTVNVDPAALEGTQYALPPASQEVINAAVTAAIAALRADGTLGDHGQGAGNGQGAGYSQGVNGYPQGANGYPQGANGYSQGANGGDQGANFGGQGAGGYGQNYGQPNAGQPNAAAYGNDFGGQNYAHEQPQGYAQNAPYGQPFVAPEPPQSAQHTQSAQPAQPDQPAQSSFTDDGGFYESYKKPKYDDDDDDDDD